MKRIYSAFTLTLVAAFAFLSACTDRYPIGELANNSNRLVVEGSFTNEARVHTIILSRTLAYTTPTTDGKGYPQETGAQVTVTDNVGNTIAFTETSPGVYTSAATAQGVTGRIYTLNITTSDGKKYNSLSDRMAEVPPIKDLNVRYEDRTDIFENTTEKLALIEIAFDDSVNVSNYYQWYWNDNTENQFNPVDSTWNWAFNNDQYFDGEKVRFDLAEFTQGTARYVKIYHTSITQNAYDFLNLLNGQSDNSLGPFSTPPSPIKGNVINSNDSKDFALGLFKVSSVASQIVTIE